MTGTNIKSKGYYRLSPDGNFAIQPVPPNPESEAEFQTTSDYLYVKENFDIGSMPIFAQMIQAGFIVFDGTSKIYNRKYNRFRYRRWLVDERPYSYEKGVFELTGLEGMNENDCLKFSESMVLSNNNTTSESVDAFLKMDTSEPVMHAKASHEEFGKSTAQNRRIIQNTPDNEKNDYALPEPGECYAIVRKTSKQGRADYHIAFVLCQHQGINITLEAEADNGPTYQPKFCWYDTDPAKHTFHKRWTGQIYPKGDPRHGALYGNGITIVLQARECVLNKTWIPEKQKKRKVPVLSQRSTRRKQSA